MPRLTPKAARLVRNAIRAAINASWSGADPLEDRPALEQDARDTRRKLAVYIAELEQSQHTLRNIMKKA